MFWGCPPLFCMCGKMENGGNSALSVQVYIQAYESLHDFLGGKNVAGKNRKRRRFNELTLKFAALLERDTSLELATYCLGSSHSTG